MVAKKLAVEKAASDKAAVVKAAAEEAAEGSALLLLLCHMPAGNTAGQQGKKRPLDDW
jgi:membrane protein involved in colicin uptake